MEMIRMAGVTCGVGAAPTSIVPFMIFHDLTGDRNGAMVTHPFEIVVRPFPIPFRCSICARLVGPRAWLTAEKRT
jgi:hypothetical protein